MKNPELDGRFLTLLALSGLAIAKKLRGSRGVVRAGRQGTTTKSISITYDLLTEESLANNGYADSGYWQGDGDLVSNREIEDHANFKVIPWEFTPGLYAAFEDLPDRHEATVRCVAKHLIELVGREYPGSTTEPLWPKPEDLIAHREHFRVSEIDDRHARGKIDGQPIKSMDITIQLEDGWRLADAELLNGLLAMHDAEADRETALSAARHAAAR